LTRRASAASSACRSGGSPRSTRARTAYHHRQYAGVVLDGLASTAAGARNAALFRAAAALGRRVAAGQLPEPDVEQGLYAAAERNGLVADDGERAVQRTIRSGLDAAYRG